MKRIRTIAKVKDLHIGYDKNVQADLMPESGWQGLNPSGIKGVIYAPADAAKSLDFDYGKFYLVTIEEIGPPQNGVHQQDYYGPILEQLALDDNGGDGSSALRKLKGFS